MNPELFLADIEAVPHHLAALADVVEPWPISSSPRRILMLGMGSSYFAAIPVAARMRAAGLDAVAERASNALTWPAASDLLVVAISATGRSAETLAAIEPHLGRSRVIALTNDLASPLAEQADAAIAMHAGVEAGGVACRTYRHTIAQLLALSGADVAPALRLAAAASADLLDRRAGWLPELLAALDSADGIFLLAPAERLASALQGALMVREGPRRRADGCETGDWSHVDVYLTKTLDYRALVFAGSQHEAAAAEWMAQRGSTAVAVGGGFPGARCEVRYDHDDHPIVALLTEVIVAELVAASWWA